LTQLDYFDISLSKIGGTIPLEIGNLTNLRSLILENVPLTGNLPSTITLLSKLERLILPFSLTATLPDNIGDLPHLRSLIYLNQNFYGTIPSSLGQLQNLTLLYFWNTSLIGTIPSTFNQLTELNFLSIGNNSLTGTIPKGLSSLTKLRHLVIGEKGLSGYVDISGYSDLLGLDLNFETPVQLLGCPPDRLKRWRISDPKLKELSQLKLAI